MKTRLNPYKSLPVLACLLACLTFGCASGERGANGDPDLPDLVETELHIGISDASLPAQTKAGEVNTDPLEGELIHSLVVFIVNTNGTIEKKFQPDLSSNTEAQAGNLTKWSSGTFQITGGTKTIYAFANWESLEESNFITTQEGANLSLPPTVEWENNSFDLAKNSFLPMSAQEQWTVTAGTKKIELVRLVSRLKVKVTNETQHDITIKSLNIGEFNIACNLFKGTILPTTTGWTLNNVKFNSTELKGRTDQAGTADAIVSGWYYVNESDTKSNGFKVDLETESQYHNGTNEHGGTTYTRLCQSIPRNHVWNLNIVFSSYQITLKIYSENPPIGGYPEEMLNADGITNLDCPIKGGGPFRIEIVNLKSLDDKTEDLTNVTYSIDPNTIIDDKKLLAENPHMAETSSERKPQIKGRMVGAALANESASFRLKAQKGGKTLVTFQVNLLFKDIFESQP